MAIHFTMYVNCSLNMKRYPFYLPLLLAVSLAGCKDPTNDSVTSGSTIGTTISDSTYTNSGDFIEQ